MLTTTRPSRAQLVVFSMREHQFVPVPPPDHGAVLLDHESISLHRSSEEAAVQLAGVEDEDGVARPAERKVRDNFNYWQKPTQTPRMALRDAGVQRSDVEKLRHSSQVSLSIITDAYAKHERLGSAGIADSIGLEERMELALRVLERMVVMNLDVQMALDAKDLELPLDDEQGKGRLMNLWDFSYQDFATSAVTYLCWNPKFKDIFAAAFGDLDFHAEDQEGAVRLYTLANFTHPAYECRTPSAVTCVAFYEAQPSFMAVGLKSGMVAVYRVGRRSIELQYESDPVNDKHAYPVQEVQWCRLEEDNQKILYSVSKDGRVCRWKLTYNKLVLAQVMTVYSANNPTVLAPDNLVIRVKAHIMTVVFYPTEPNMFLIGTKVGNIYKCSTAFTSKFLFTFHAHDNLINKIEFNRFDPTVFITCSDDGLVKIWKDERRECLFRFDVVGVCVGDACWSPTNSTVFVACSDRAVVAYDVDADKHAPVCVHGWALARSEMITRLAWNSFQPLIIAGNSRALVRALKTSPSLRKIPRVPRRGPALDPRDLELKKLETILHHVTEPAVLERPPDVAVVDKT